MVICGLLLETHVVVSMWIVIGHTCSGYYVDCYWRQAERLLCGLLPETDGAVIMWIVNRRQTERLLCGLLTGDRRSSYYVDC